MRDFICSLWKRIRHSATAPSVPGDTPGPDQVARDIRSVLKSELAHYEWGTGKIWFAGLSAVKHLSPAEIFVSLAQSSGRWTSTAEFRQTVAVLHEVVHYLQDISTGVGHWDYVARRRALNTLIGNAKSASHAATSFPPVPGPAEDKQYKNAFSSSFYDAWTHRESELRTELERTLSENPEFDPQSDFQNLLSVESVMETEAVIQVFRTVEHFLTTSNEARQIRDENAPLYNPIAMSNIYRGLNELVLKHMFHWLGIESQEDLDAFENEAEKPILGTYGLYLLLFDLSLAHPPPTFFVGSRHRPRDFHPGVKFLHLMRALYAPPKELTEHGILEVCAVKYPSSSEVDQMWIEYFSSEPAFANDPVARLRIALCERRRAASSFIAKVLNTPIFYDAPLAYEIEGHPKEYISTVNKLTGDENVQQITNRLKWDAILLGLTDWIFMNVPFQCPAASMCTVREDICMRGITMATQLPGKSGCYVRAFLKTEGFRLEEGLRR